MKKKMVLLKKKNFHSMTDFLIKHSSPFEREFELTNTLSGEATLLLFSQWVSVVNGKPCSYRNLFSLRNIHIFEKKNKTI